MVVASTAVLLALPARAPVKAKQQPDDPETDERKAEKKADGKQVEPTLVGNWQRRLGLHGAGGRQSQDSCRGDAPVSVIISEKTFTMRAGDDMLADMSYVLDPKQDPWTIDLKSKEGVMLGICSQEGDMLEISLDDEAKGRPRDFDTGKERHGAGPPAISGWSLFVINADGSNLHPILTMPRLHIPRLSRLVARRPQDRLRRLAIGDGRRLPDAHVLVVNADGSAMKDLGPGAMPSWSLDDKQLTYCQYGPERGVWIMNADGSHRRRLDAGGWGSQWSPKRNEIAYTIYDDGGADLCIYDVAKEQRRELPHKAYRQIYWGLTWSPDGKLDLLQGDPARGRFRNRRRFRRRTRRKDSRCSCQARHCPRSATPNDDGLGWNGQPNPCLHAEEDRPPAATLCFRFHRRQAAPVISQVSGGLDERRHGLVVGRKESGLVRFARRIGAGWDSRTECGTIQGNC